MFFKLVQKKYFLIIFLFSNSIISQEEYGFKYPDANQDLKELIAIQSLLGENRLNDLEDFLIKNSYVFIGNSEKTTYAKLRMGNENSIDLIITIETNTNNSDISKYYTFVNLSIKDQNNKPTFELNKTLAGNLRYWLFKQFEVGTLWNMFPKDISEINISNYPDLEIKKINKYQINLIENDSVVNIIKASNSMMDQESSLKFHFMGPGKTLFTTINFIKNSDTINRNKHLVRFSLFSNINKNIDFKPFEVDLFMSQKNFNDIIWADR